jgi:hypothetical protein
MLLCSVAQAQVQPSKLTGNEVSINGFRNPSIGLELRHNQFSVHAGYYTTIHSSEGKAQDHSNNFLKAGLSVWYLPFGKAETPSALYSSASWLLGIDQEYKGQQAVMIETGARLHIWHGLNVRLGIAALMAADKSTQINPTPGISYSFRLK